MARKRKRSYGRRRRRVGAIKQDKLMQGVGVVGGLLLTAFINDKLSQMEKPIDPLILAGGEVVLGFFGPDFVGRANPLIQGIGLGVMGAGGLNALKETGVITGVQVINGWNNGFRPVKAINGLPDVVKQYAEGKAPVSASNQVINGIYGSGTKFDETPYGLEG